MKEDTAGDSPTAPHHPQTPIITPHYHKYLNINLKDILKMFRNIAERASVQAATLSANVTKMYKFRSCLRYGRCPMNTIVITIKRVTEMLIVIIMIIIVRYTSRSLFVVCCHEH